MGDVLVLGGGVCGLATGMMLARDGHDVTLLERDDSPLPANAGEATRWDRPGVSQFIQAHYMHGLFRHVLDANLPDVRDELLSKWGALRYDPLIELIPPTISDREPREGDDRFWTVTARRAVLEAAFATAASKQEGLEVRRGVKISSLLAGTEVIPGVPHIVGAQTDQGEFNADFVVDAMGRASKLPEMLTALGGRPPFEEAEECGYTYYGRTFRSKGGEMPASMGTFLVEIGSVSVLTLPADNDTWQIVVFIAAGDQPLKELRHEEKWNRLVSSVPLKAHWLDGEALGPIQAMSGIMDRRRTFQVDGQPVVTGLAAVADAWACTNPSLGRGISLGIRHASCLRDAVRDAHHPKQFAEDWNELTMQEFDPWYDAQVTMDRARVAEMDAAREGRVVEQDLDDPAAAMTRAFMTAVRYDADVFRGFLEIMACISTPQEVVGGEGMFEKMVAASEGREPFKAAGPTREELLAICA